MQKLLSGNEAIAQGAWEAGVRVGVGYPGTPSTETLENLSTYDDVSASGRPTRRSPSRSRSEARWVVRVAS